MRDGPNIDWETYDKTGRSRPGKGKQVKLYRLADGMFVGDPVGWFSSPDTREDFAVCGSYVVVKADPALTARSLAENLRQLADWIESGGGA